MFDWLIDWQASMLFHTSYLPLSLIEFWSQISENIFFLDLLVQKVFFDKNHWFQLPSTKNEWIISLFLISITLHSLSVSHSIMSSVCKKENKLWPSMKTIFSPSQPMRENFVSRFTLCLSFIFFVFVFWPIETTTAKMQTHSNPCKMY